jgi:hypothetical protein
MVLTRALMDGGWSVNGALRVACGFGESVAEMGDGGEKKSLSLTAGGGGANIWGVGWWDEREAGSWNGGRRAGDGVSRR